jgi:hypothetical protein
MSGKRALVAAAVVLVLAVIGAVWYFAMHPKAAGPAVVAEAPHPGANPPPPAPAILHPMPEGGDGAGLPPLPALNDSDAAIMAALSEVIGADAAKAYLVPEDLIRHIVVTVDNLPRQKIPVSKRPVTAAPGAFQAEGDELHATLDSRNFSRYRPMVAVIRTLDMERVANLYARFYPLFQSAYQDLGYPNGYFNDRLIEVIDMLLATPQVSPPIELARPNVMFVYADAALEARPAGQKLLIRIGPDNAVAVKAKLLELRAALTALPIKKK